MLTVLNHKKLRCHTIGHDSSKEI